MSNQQITNNQFRTMAVEKFSFLEDYGFHRASGLEETSSMVSTVVYLGKHVGFIISLDLREEYVDAEVVKVEGGKIKYSWAGGYSSSIFMHLVEHEGYRGGLGSNSSEESNLGQMIDQWVDLLKSRGQTLLSDSPDSLPR